MIEEILAENLRELRRMNENVERKPEWQNSPPPLEAVSASVTLCQLEQLAAYYEVSCSELLTDGFFVDREEHSEEEIRRMTDRWIGLCIRRYRMKHHITPYQAWKHTGLRHNAFLSKERGSSAFKVYDLENIADAFGVGMEDLIGAKSRRALMGMVRRSYKKYEREYEEVESDYFQRGTNGNHL